MGGGYERNNPPILRDMIVLRQKIFFQSRATGEYFTGADVSKLAKESRDFVRLHGIPEKHVGTRIKDAYAQLQTKTAKIPIEKTETVSNWFDRKAAAKDKALGWLENKGVVKRVGDHGWTVPKPTVAVAAASEGKGLAKSGKIMKRIKSLLRK